MPPLSIVKRLAAALAMVASAGPGVAGSGMLSAPVDARLVVDRATSPVGGEVTARLTMTALADIPQLAITIGTNGCMAVRAPATPSAVQNIRKGQVIDVSARFTVTAAAPCTIVAQAITFADGKNRLGSVYGVAVNAVPVAPLPGLHKGKTRDGAATIDAPAAR